MYDGLVTAYLRDGEAVPVLVDPEESGLCVSLTQHDVAPVSEAEVEGGGPLMIGLEELDILCLDGGNIEELGKSD